MLLDTITWRSSEVTLMKLEQLVLDGEHHSKHLIYVLEGEVLNANDLNLLLRLTQVLNDQKLSLVLVSETLSYEDVLEGIGLCPTIDEAYDLVELEAIQRDLEA